MMYKKIQGRTTYFVYLDDKKIDEGTSIEYHTYYYISGKILQELGIDINYNYMYDRDTLYERIIDMIRDEMKKVDGLVFLDDLFDRMDTDVTKKDFKESLIIMQENREIKLNKLKNERTGHKPFLINDNKYISLNIK